MEPFSITCTTCGARLTVRSQAAIGQILGCPRCKSMVLVERPAATGPAAPDLSETLDALPGDDGRATSDVGPLASSDSAWAETLPELDVGDAPWSGEPADTAEGRARWKDQQPAAPAVAADGADDTEGTLAGSGPVLPSDAWSSPATSRLRQWALVALAAATGLALAVAVLMFLAYRANPGTRAVTSTGEDDQTGQTPATAAEDDQTGQTPATAAEDDLTGQTPATVVEEAPAGQKPATIAEAAPTGQKPAAVAEEAPAGQKPAAVEGQSPLVEGPPGLEPPPDDDPRGLPDDAVAGLLERFAPLLSNAPFEAPAAPADDPLPPVPAGEPAAAPGDAAGAGEPAAPSVAFPPPQRPAPREIDVAAQLATPILEIEFEDTPLDGFLQFVWQFSTVPVSVDLDALQRRKLSLRTPIRLTRRDTSLGEVLAAGLQPLGLDYVVAAGQLRIVEADRQPREVRYPVDDLLGDDQAAAAMLVRWVATLAQPAAWASMGEGGGPQVEGQSLVVQHTPAVQFAVVELLEKLRVARQLPLRSDYDAANFQLPTRRERASQKLAETFLLNFTQPTPLPRILQRIGEDTGAHLVVDWQAVGQTGWTPETRLQFSSDSRPLRVALNSLLRPLDLVYRVIDAETIEVTTSQALEQDPDLEFYPVDGLLKNDPDARQLMDRIQQTLGKDLFAPAGAGAMQFDPASQCLLVLLPQSRQLELYELLLQLRARP